MSLVAVLNSQPEVQSLVEAILSSDPNRTFVLASAKTSEEALEILSFDLPEIVLWNATDPAFDPETFREALKGDSWMHNFGIVAFYDPKVATEVQANERLHGVNVLTILPLGALAAHLLKHLTILDANRQLLVHLELADQGQAKSTGSFNIENDPTVVPVYAGLAAQTLVQRGFLPADRKRDLQIALVELIQNGIEHGHVGLSSQEKNEYLAKGGSIPELIKTKVENNPSLALKKVTLEWEIEATETKFFVRDQGPGFDVLAYRERMRRHQTDELSGRGIKLARSMGGKLSFNKTGNVACLQIAHDPTIERSTPRGFEAEEVVVANKGDLVFRQDEVSDHLFYIISGQFGVYHEGVPVGLLTPSDVFMGEMSFLMNNIRTATVICETPGRLVKISRRSFVRTLRLYPQYGLFLAKLMARKLSQGNQERSNKVIKGWEGDALE